MVSLKNIQAYWETLWDLIFPPLVNCIVCKKQAPMDLRGICRHCLEEINIIPKGRWLQTGNIIEEGNRYRMFSVVKYQGVIRRLVYRLKYNHETYLARNMARMMVELIHREGITGELIIPVPLYKSREKERGFNQAALLAKYISQYRGIPYSNNNLLRIKNTKVMHRLSKGARKINVMDAFALKKPEELMGKKVILIDDILTTGATLEACLLPLVEAGISDVTVVTFARVSQNLKM